MWLAVRSASLEHAAGRLVAALQREPYRSLEPRLSLGPEWRPYRPRRGKAPLAVRAAAGSIVPRARKSGRPEIAAAAHLVDGATATAVAEFRDGVRRHDSAAAWSDYAAALLVASREADDPLAALDALAASDRALALEPLRAEALFNRALALRELGLADEARRAFVRAAAAGGDPGWAREAAADGAALRVVPTTDSWKKVLDEIEKAPPDGATLARLADRYPQPLRTYAENAWTADWAQATEEHDRARAEARLDLARRAAQAIRARSGEALAADAIAVIDRATPATRTLLAAAYRRYRAGRLAHANGNPTTGELLLRESEALFARAGSPMQQLARYYVGSTLFEQFRLVEADAILVPLAEERPERRGYHALAAQIGWERGSIAALRGAFSTAFTIFDHSTVEAAILREPELATRFAVLSAGAHDLAYDARAAWRIRRTVLAALSRSGDPSRIRTTVENAAMACALRQEWERTIALTNIVQGIAEGARNPALATHAHGLQALAFAHLGDDQAAFAALARARRAAATIRDERYLARLAADQALAVAVLAAPRRPALALAKLQEAMEFAVRAGEAVRLPRLHLEMARVHRQVHDDLAARAEIDRGLAEIERQRALVQQLAGRAEIWRAADELFDEGLALALAAKDVGGAFDSVERQRSRALLDAFTGSPSTVAAPLDARTIRASLADDSAIVSYRTTSAGLLAFVARPQRLTVTPVRITPDALAALADRYLRAAGELEEARATAAAKQLSAALLEPIAPLLEGARRIAFIPAPELASVPFAMLPLGGERLGDRATVFQSPSATLAVECSRRADQRDGDSTLAAAGSVIDRDLYADLPLLPFVESEARDAAAAHAPSKVLAGAAATPSAVLEALPKFAIAHLAAHAVGGRESAADAVLLLAPGAGDRGALRASAIAATPLPRTRLVLLAACASGKSTRSGDGAVNFATAFLQSGVPTVVATMWNADDASTAALMRAFHGHLRHADVPDALHAALRDTPRGTLRQGGLSILGGIRGFVREKTMEKEKNP